MSNNDIEIISIGNELLSGITLNTNASFIADKISRTGLTVRWITTISDSPQEIISELEIASNRARIIIVTGGLGPTPDDITKNAIAFFFKTKLVLHQPSLNHIRNLFEGRGMKMPATNKNQAMVPANATIITNNYGTAPGLEFDRDGKLYFFLPGVPHEMKALINEYVIPKIKDALHPSEEDHHIFRTNGLAESKLFEKIKNIIESQAVNYTIAFLPKSHGVDIRIKSKSGQKIDSSFLDDLRASLVNNIYSESENSLPEVVSKLLVEKKYTLAIAESFTGGLISDWLTNIPGCSDFLLASAVTYSNQSKMDVLDVSGETIENFGAVSSETVKEMVIGIQKKFNTDCAIATTGIAGPGGATDKKPVGLCYLAACLHDHILIKSYNLGKDRRINKERGAAISLELLRKIILSIPD